jgi:hypothetical protein
MRLRQIPTRRQRRNFYRQAQKDVITRRLLQALDDAISFRSGLLSTPCPAYTGPHRCAEHAQNETLVATYQQMPAGTSERLHHTANRQDTPNLKV